VVILGESDAGNLIRPDDRLQPGQVAVDQRPGNRRTDGELLAAALLLPEIHPDSDGHLSSVHVLAAEARGFSVRGARPCERISDLAAVP
jgi:hypothetical protein